MLVEFLRINDFAAKGYWAFDFHFNQSANTDAVPNVTPEAVNE